MRSILACAAAMLVAATPARAEVIAMICRITGTTGMGRLAYQQGAMHLQVDTAARSVTITRNLSAGSAARDVEKYDNSESHWETNKVDIRQDVLAWSSSTQNTSYTATMNRKNGDLVENDRCGGCVVVMVTNVTYSCTPETR